MEARRRGGLPQSTVRGMLISGIGLAHFIRPQQFEPVNVALGFDRDTRKYVYVNGAIETAIGLSVLHARTRRLTPVAAAGYITYLVVMFTASRFRRESRQGTRRSSAS